jgi:integrase
MAVDDVWYRSKPDPTTGDRVPTSKHGRGMRWRVRYEDDAGNNPERMFAKRSDAVAFDLQVRSSVQRGVYVDVTAGQVKLKDYAETWRTALPHRDSTAVLIERSFRVHVNPVLGGLPLASVRRSQVQSWVTGLDLAASTARLVYGHLAAMFADAAEDRVIGASPCGGVKLPELPHAEHLILTPEQVHKLAAELPAYHRAIVYVGAGCGLRPSEIFGLELSNIDFLRREIHVVQQLRTATGRPPFLAPVKTRTSRRTVELPKVTADALARHLQRFPAVEVPVSDETAPRSVHTRPAKLLFTAGGDLISRSIWSKAWGPAARRVGLPVGTGLHSLRHYYATLLIFAGANVKTVQLALGHSTPMVTLNSYVGMWPDAVDRTRNLVDAALGDLPKVAAK